MSSNTAVDLALVLAAHCSSSADDGDFRLHMDGIAAALRNPALFKAVASGSCRQIAIALVQWSSATSQIVTIGWRMLTSRLDLAKSHARDRRSQADVAARGNGPRCSDRLQCRSIESTTNRGPSACD